MGNGGFAVAHANVCSSAERATARREMVGTLRSAHPTHLDHRCAGAANLRESGRLYRERGPLADHQFRPAAFLRLDVGATPTGTGAPQGQRVGGIGMWNLNAITPETETTSHYFWGQAHNFDIHNPKTTEMLVEQIRTAFHEDVAVFETQQRNLVLILNPPQTDINADAGVIQARRVLDRLYQEE